MSYGLKIMDEAEQDIIAIEEHLIEFGAGTVRNFFSHLKGQVSELKTMPLICPAYERDPFFRRMVLGDYLLFYSVDKSPLFLLRTGYFAE